MEAVILIGVQGSGKTTFYRERFFETHVRVSRDMLRTARRERLLVAACLAAGQSFVVDNTNALASRRAEHVAPAKAAGFRVVGFFFRCELRDALARNRLRPAERVVPPAGVAGTYKKLQQPSWGRASTSSTPSRSIPPADSSCCPGRKRRTVRSPGCEHPDGVKPPYWYWNLISRGEVVSNRRRRPVLKLRVAAVLALGLAMSLASSALPPGERATAIFAGGCFWCEETAFEGLPGVFSVVSGYTGGQTKNPTYEQVSAGGTGHAESVEVTYDPARTSYEKLLEVFWHNVDPFQKNGQFCDHGTQYRSAIFYRDEAQKKAAEESKRKLEEQERFKGKIATQIVPASTFYPAEEYHQDFYKKNPVRYHEYREGCGRDARLKQIWGEAAGGRK